MTTPPRKKLVPLSLCLWKKKKSVLLRPMMRERPVRNSSWGEGEGHEHEQLPPAPGPGPGLERLAIRCGAGLARSSRGGDIRPGDPAMWQSYRALDNLSWLGMKLPRGRGLDQENSELL